MQSLASPSTSYAAPAVISLGEEYTDASLPASSNSSQSFESSYDEEYYYSSSSGSETDSENGDDSDYSPISPRDDGVPHRRRSSIVPALWHAEHARLLSLQTAVLDNERAAWTREKRLESEVARIKVDLARLQQQQQQQQQSKSTPNDNTAAQSSSLNSVRTSAPIDEMIITATTSPTPSSSTFTPPRCAGPRGPRPKPQQLRSSSGQTRIPTGVSHSESAPPLLLPKFSFESIKEQAQAQAKPEQPEQQTAAVTVLSHHLIQARSQRAQERQRRRNEHERMRELATLLTLGSEVRKWEERLAWSQIHSATRAAASDDSHLNTESVAKTANNNDTDIDPRGKRLSRSSSLPSNRMSYVPPAPTTTTTTSSQPQEQQQSATPSPAPLSPALPSLALSPLWRVSAEMILRRRQLSERPRRTPPPPAPLVVSQQAPVGNKSPTTTQAIPVGTTLARPAHTLRGPRDKRTVSSSTSSTSLAASVSSSSISAWSSSTATPTTLVGTSSGSGSLSVKRNSIPPPISIPPSASFCSTTAVTSANASGNPPSQRLGAPTGTSCTFLFSKTTPVRPSALKWAFTADDLAREMEEEENRRKELLLAAQRQTETAQTCCTESSSEASSSEGDSGSDSSGKSSSDGGGSSSSGQECPAPVATGCGGGGGGVERRGRARFSWRKSIPKDGSASCPNAANANIPPTPPIASVNVET